LDVQDSGVGIAKADINKLFQKFSRIHNELSISSGGTGLGLYLSRLIVELHKGTISVISEYGKGSVFRVKLPKTRDEDIE
jgi:signal transduction histidine kinase